MSNFAEDFQQAMERALLKLIREGNVLQLDYKDRMSVPSELIRGAYARIDIDRLKTRLADVVEEKVVDGIFNAMVTEVTTDVKQIMSNRELREDLRAYLRQRIREAADALKPEVS